MTSTSELVCLYHHRRYASRIQRIINLFRTTHRPIKCDLNFLAKSALCICKLKPQTPNVHENEFVEIQKQYQHLPTTQFINEANRILAICSCQISNYRLMKFICDLSNEELLRQTIKQTRKAQLIRSSRYSLLIRRRIQLNIPRQKMLQLIGTRGRIHKQLMSETNTNIHFENLPYTIAQKNKNRTTTFDLEAFQSAIPLNVVLTGDSEQTIENAIKVLERFENK